MNKFNKFILVNALLLAISSQASAAVIEIGTNAYANPGGNGIAIGENAIADEMVSPGTFGYGWSLALGNQATARRGSIAIGDGASGDFGATVIGNGASAGERGIAIGLGSSTGNGIAIGGLASGWASLSIGGTASAEGSAAILGTADAARSVALGQGAHTQGRTNVVSVGNTGAERQITNVAAGVADTDAVNVKQLNDAIGGGGTANPYFNASGTGNGNDASQATGGYSTAAGALAIASGDGATVVGALSTADQVGGTVVGQGSYAGDTSTAIGAASSAGAGGRSQNTAIGYGAKADTDNSVALGAFTQSTRSSEVAVGDRQITQVLAGTEDNDAVIVSQMAPMVAALGGGANFNNGFFTAPTYVYISGATYNNVGDALADLDGRVNALEQLPPGGTGPAGPAGPAGPQGERGEQGVAGNDGAPGERGEQGVAGNDGAPGERGERGEQGVAGNDGAPGAPGERGEQGVAGNDGVPGERGERGEQGVAGTNGLDGRSAYEVAVADGFTGTQTEWLASLEGAAGRDGIDGRDGGEDPLAVRYDDEDKDAITLAGEHGTTISNVANGSISQGSTEAVNGGQIWALEQDFNDRWTEVNHRIDGLEGAIDAVGAQGAALTMMSGAGSYLPVGKVAISAGYGQYGSKSAFAVGAKVRLTERASASFGLSATPSGGGKLMFGAGVSYILP